ncbi:single-stranded DNA-binding protein [Lysinibacillus sp. SGAir0095]|uniref:single-stranded DNA-binding protein n=1 Tax=Lysinibacillus sp. SGAir0095 TaxID=2070463 RepID=UPI0010CD69D6|nr:single-stranded DNA-binding protein [Lysinibacillus sp. SGAir0095]QCR33151.1 single-stranded DNA-binding protein [Lysinibacillus sp. SGAir0095]
MINRVVLVGRLTKDPELRYTPSGVPMTRFTVAVNRTFKQEGQPEADFIGCLAWRKQAENLANFMKKGSLIGVEGRIQTGSFEGQDGKRVYTTDVVADAIQFLEPRSNNSDGSNSAPNYQPNTNYQSQPNTQNMGQHGGYNQQNNGQSAQYSQQNYTRVDEDPFASNKGPIQVTEDDLPF